MSESVKLASLFGSIVTLGSTPIVLSAGYQYWLQNQWWFYCQSNAMEPICQVLF